MKNLAIGALRSRLSRSAWVEFDHGDGLRTRFAYLSKILAEKSQTVAGGDIIGRTGSTGRSTGPHLHYEIGVNGRAVDPMTFGRPFRMRLTRTARHRHIARAWGD